jgi:regulator of sirC expression with transglutaminase-like and TPR domain
MDGYEQALRSWFHLLERWPDASLEEALLHISAVLQPGLDVIEQLCELDELAATCPVPTREGVVRYLAIDEGFGGPLGRYEQWQNSCLDEVLRRRAGLPISLVAIGIAVGRRLGVDLVGIGMPMHFLLGDPADPEWFADLYAGEVEGEPQFLGREDCQRRFAELGGGTWSEEFLQPVPASQIIIRTLNNLRNHCRHDPLRLALVMKMRAPLFDDQESDYRRTTAVLN